MSLILQGDASHVQSARTATVVGIASNGSGAERVETSAPHLFGDTDFVQLRVTISAVAVVQSGTIQVIDSTHFDLVGSTFTATGTGTATDLSLTPAIRVPTDGDEGSLQLSGMLSALQALADRTQALRTLAIDRSVLIAVVTTTSSIPIPPWCTAFLVVGAGGGGGGGGGSCGNNVSASFVSGNVQVPAGSGGAGAPEVLFPVTSIPVGTTRIDVVIGAGGAGGAGVVAGTLPSAAGVGNDGGTTA
jgi:hypothetical protein